MKIYVKLRNNAWILVNRKIEQTTITNKKKVTRYLLAGETVSNPPISNKSDYVEIKIPGGIVNKVISKLLDFSGDGEVIIEPKDKEYYVAKTTRDKRQVVEKILTRTTTP